MKAGAFDFEGRPRAAALRVHREGAGARRLGAAGPGGGPVVALRPPGGPGDAGTGGRRWSAPSTPQLEEWPEKERLAMEKEAIGFYVSGHPLHQYARELQRYARPAASVQRARRDDVVTVAGIVAALRERPTKTGKRMAWVTLEDLSGSVELVCFPGKEGGRSVMGKDGKWTKSGPRPGYDAWEPLLKSDEPILVHRHGPGEHPRRGEPHRRAHRRAGAVAQGGPRQAGEATRAARPGGPGHRGSAGAALRAGEGARRGDAAGGLHRAAPARPRR